MPPARALGRIVDSYLSSLSAAPVPGIPIGSLPASGFRPVPKLFLNPWRLIATNPFRSILMVPFLLWRHITDSLVQLLYLRPSLVSRFPGRRGQCSRRIVRRSARTLVHPRLGIRRRPAHAPRLSSTYSQLPRRGRDVRTLRSFEEEFATA